MDESLNNHKAGKRTFLWQNALFPGVISVCAFICFAIVYWLLTAMSIEPLYLAGLIFIFPCLLFGLIAYTAGKGKLKNQASAILTAVLIPVCLFGSLFCLFIVGMSQTSATVTSVSRYERTFKLAKFSQTEQLSIFPEKIPADATDTAFYYNADGWMEYSRTVALQFSADKETISNYVDKFRALAISESSSNIKNVFGRVGEPYIKDLSGDYTVYVMMNDGSHNRKVSAVAISQLRNNIIFYAYTMSW